jgi:hypothetical protein
VRAIRISATFALGLVIVYNLLRLAAGQCSGSQCDAYIPISLLVPIGIVVLIVVTGSLAIRDARVNGGPWVALLGAATVLGAGAPVLAAVVLRDQPDILFTVATVLFVQAPLVAWAYTFRQRLPQVP